LVQKGRPSRPSGPERRKSSYIRDCFSALLETIIGCEFISRDLDLSSYANYVTLDFSRPGKSTDNGFIEASNSKLRAECLRS